MRRGPQWYRRDREATAPGDVVVALAQVAVGGPAAGGAAGVEAHRVAGARGARPMTPCRNRRRRGRGRHEVAGAVEDLDVHVADPGATRRRSHLARDATIRGEGGVDPGRRRPRRHRDRGCARWGREAAVPGDVVVALALVAVGGSAAGGAAGVEADRVAGARGPHSSHRVGAVGPRTRETVNRAGSVDDFDGPVAHP